MDYPYSFENGAGEVLTFTGRTVGPEGERVEGDTLVSPGAGPPMHVHYLQAEGFTVLEGRIAIQRMGRDPEYAGVGEAIVFAAGEPHRFWNPERTPLRCAAWIAPPGNAEFFLRSLFEAQRERPGRGPGIFDAAFLLWRYRSEFALLAIPPLVVRWVFPVVVAVGTALGRYRKYAGAPEPLRGRE